MGQTGRRRTGRIGIAPVDREVDGISSCSKDGEVEDCRRGREGQTTKRSVSLGLGWREEGGRMKVSGVGSLKEMTWVPPSRAPETR
jgi:hypothetical protein